MTAAALQATPQHTVIWLAANVKPKLRTGEHLQGVLNALVRVTADGKLSTPQKFLIISLSSVARG